MQTTSNASPASSAPTRAKLIIVGNGMATGRLLDEIIQLSPNKFDITVIGDEPHGSYNRILLSTVLAKETHYNNIIDKPASWYQSNNICFINSTRVTAIDKENKTIITETNSTETAESSLSYDHLILATGSRAAKIPAKNQELIGIFAFRTILDTQRIEHFAQDHQKAIVIGGGLLGLEAAYGLASTGVEVTLIHRNKWLLNRQLDQNSGALLKAVLAEKNIQFVLGEEVTQFNEQTNSNGEKVMAGATLTNGQKLEADMAIIATGITPNKELGFTCDLTVDRAIIVDDYMLTSDENISALGECCQHNNSTFGLVDPIWKQCVSLAERLANNSQVPFVNSPVATKLKVSGVQLFSAGVVESSDDSQSFILCDNKARIYRKLIIKNNTIIGIVLFGDVSSGMDYFDLMQAKTDISAHLPTLLLGSEFMLEQENNAALEAEQVA